MEDFVNKLVSEFDIWIRELEFNNVNHIPLAQLIRTFTALEDTIHKATRFRIEIVDMVRCSDEIYNVNMLHEIGHAIGFNIIDQIGNKYKHYYSVIDFFGKQVPIEELKRTMKFFKEKEMNMIRSTLASAFKCNILDSGEQWEMLDVEQCAVFFQCFCMFEEEVRKLAPTCSEVFVKNAKDGMYGYTIMKKYEGYA